MPRQPDLSINFNTGSAQGGPTAAELTKRIRAQIIGNKWTSPGGGLILSIEIPQTVSQENSPPPCKFAICAL